MPLNSILYNFNYIEYSVFGERTGHIFCIFSVLRPYNPHDMKKATVFTADSPVIPICHLNEKYLSIYNEA
jgi:hypothetical protein